MNQNAIVDDPAESTEVQSQDSPDVIGQRLVDTGLITAEQLRYARQVQNRMPGTANLMGVLEELHLTTADTVRPALKNQRIHAPIGLLLFELGYVDNSHLKMALTVQKGRPTIRLARFWSKTGLFPKSSSSMFSRFNWAWSACTPSPLPSIAGSYERRRSGIDPAT
jgi:hypothetical protein